MKLETSPLAETSTGMTNLQNQLANLTIQMHEFKKGKEVAQEDTYLTSALYFRSMYRHLRTYTASSASP